MVCIIVGISKCIQYKFRVSRNSAKFLRGREIYKKLISHDHNALTLHRFYTTTEYVHHYMVDHYVRAVVNLWFVNVFLSSFLHLIKVYVG